MAHAYVRGPIPLTQATLAATPRYSCGRTALRGYLMTSRHWKFSQVASLVFVGAMLAFGLVGAIATGDNTLMSDAVIVQSAS